MRNATVFIVLIASLHFFGSAHAEGGCPSGQYPQQGNGWRSFVGPTWQARWISLAVDSDKAILGKSGESGTDKQAEQSAVNDCISQGGTTCHVILTAKNGCIAMVVGSKRLTGFSAPTTKLAETQAVKDCEDSPDTNCKVYYTACVEPVPR
jgi:hypothetical protein